ncbi:hypothetical protein [Stappia stellulata]|uniref:hypothetical protein n=1 Tax=Stappia stellulata TaxID=71235 RepID=UPI00041DF800|nr:hypothetical protein [Stappia stellulata]
MECPGTEGETDVAGTERLFGLLARKIENTPCPWSGQDGGHAKARLNPAIPAGYTYLAQFVMHDLVVNQPLGEGLPNGAGGTSLRARPLMLDTLYGYGPAVESGCYEAIAQGADRSGWPRTRFRLDGVAGDDGAPPPDTARCPCRDIGRAVEIRNGIARGTALVADVRNDDNAVLSQLTALFQIAHNLAMDRLETGREPATPEASALHFAVARSGLTHVYHRILRKDLLARLLDPAVRRHYEAVPGAGGALCDDGDPAAGIADLTQAVLSIGHAMVRDTHRFSDAPDHAHSLRAVMERTSVRSPHHTPFNRDWIVCWSEFFDLGIVTPQLSGRIAPCSDTPLWDETLFAPPVPGQPAGLAYRDLLRCTLSGVRKIDALCRIIAERRPDVRRLSPWLSEPGLREEAMRRWLDADKSVALSGLRRSVVTNPPPTLYHLAEAAAANDGYCLGPLASIIVADRIYNLLEAHESRPASNIVAAETAKVVFGSRVPASMPDLVRWIERHLPAQHKRLGGTALRWS